MPEPFADLNAARRLMVSNQLRPQGVTDARVLAAMGAVPREDHLPANLRAMAYSDRPLRLDGGAPVMPPAELGQLLTRLAPQPGERALVLGPGGAYSAAVLRGIGLEVQQSDVHEIAVPQPFDIVLIEGAVGEFEDIFGQLLAKMLSPTGRLGAAIAIHGVTRLATGRATRDLTGKQAIRLTSFAEAQVPLLPDLIRAPAFAF